MFSSHRLRQFEIDTRNNYINARTAVLDQPSKLDSGNFWLIPIVALMAITSIAFVCGFVLGGITLVRWLAQ